MRSSCPDSAGFASLPRKGLLDLTVEIGHRILGRAVLPDFKVEVWARGHSGGTRSGDHLSGPDGVTLLESIGEVPALAIQGGQAAAMVQHQIVAQFGIESDLTHRAVRRRQDPACPPPQGCRCRRGGPGSPRFPSTGSQTESSGSQSLSGPANPDG